MSSETLSQQLLDCSAITVYFAVFDWNGFYASIFGIVLQSAVMAYKYHMVCKSLTADPPRKLTFPKQFDVTQLVMFVALAAIMIPERYTKSVAVWNNFIWSACFGVVAVIGYICDYPFIEQYARDEMPDEAWEEPAIRQHMRELALIWVVVMVLMSVSFGINPALGITELTTQEAVIVNWVIPCVLMFVGGLIHWWLVRKANAGGEDAAAEDKVVIVTEVASMGKDNQTGAPLVPSSPPKAPPSPRHPHPQWC